MKTLVVNLTYVAFWSAILMVAGTVLGVAFVFLYDPSYVL